MRELSAEARLHLRARSVAPSGRVGTRMHLVALYSAFAAEAKRRYNLDSLYMRNAGAFGALFCLMPAS